MSMLSALRNSLGATIPKRSFSQQLSHSALPSVESHSATSSRKPYFVLRNSNGALPVYTDIRNGGTKQLLLIRNCEGDVNKLAQDIAHELPQYGSAQATAARIKVKNSRHLVLDGSRWNKYVVVDWLQQKGF